MKTIYLLILAMLPISIFVWFFLCYKIFEILRQHHPEQYKAMGEPSLIMNNTSKQQALLMRFVFKREWRKLDNAALVFYGQAMLGFYVFYVVLVLFVLLLSVTNLLLKS